MVRACEIDECCCYETRENTVSENRVRSRVFRRFELTRTQPLLCSVDQFGRRSGLDKNEPHLKHDGTLSFDTCPTLVRLRFPHLRLNSARRPRDSSQLRPGFSFTGVKVSSQMPPGRQ